jgi:hypothetical protein
MGHEKGPAKAWRENLEHSLDHLACEIEIDSIRKVLRVTATGSTRIALRNKLWLSILTKTNRSLEPIR